MISFTVGTCKFVQLRVVGQRSCQIELGLALNLACPAHIHSFCRSFVPVLEDQSQALVLILQVAVFVTVQSINRPIWGQSINIIWDPCKCNPVLPLSTFRLLQIECAF